MDLDSLTAAELPRVGNRVGEEAPQRPPSPTSYWRGYGKSTRRAANELRRRSPQQSGAPRLDTSRRVGPCRVARCWLGTELAEPRPSASEIALNKGRASTVVARFWELPVLHSASLDRAASVGNHVEQAARLDTSICDGPRRVGEALETEVAEPRQSCIGRWPHAAIPPRNVTVASELGDAMRYSGIAHWEPVTSSFSREEREHALRRPTSRGGSSVVCLPHCIWWWSGAPLKCGVRLTTLAADAALPLLEWRRLTPKVLWSPNIVVAMMPPLQ